MQRLADNGLTYTQWHTTALCSPTRSVFLTGRNHHQNGFASISETSTGFPGYNSHIPRENASMATVLREAGWSTFWVGKNHNIPVDAWTMGSSKKDWPLGLGYDRFYGFIGGETNQWYPDLAEDNHYIDQPYGPEDGYHLSKDLADKALEFIRDSKQSEPDKPWYLWFCPGANHAPHHAPQEYIDKYKGKFDDGYEAYREWVLPRMIERGILPEGTELTPINPMADGAPSRGRRGPALGHAVGRGEAAVHPHGRGVRRLLGVHRRPGRPDRRLPGGVGPARQHPDHLRRRQRRLGRGHPNGSVNENKFFNAYPDAIEENLAMIDQLGAPDTYNHYPTGWAVAFSTPFRMFKRYSYQGGVADPLVIHWPAGIKARGEVRGQYHHCTDIVPTILDCCGVEMPEVVDGYKQTPLPGVSMRYTFDAADAPPPSRPSTTRCSAPAASGTRAGRRSPSTARSRSGSATSTRTAGSCSTPTPTAPRPTTWPTSTPRSSRSSRRSGSRRPRSTTSCPSTTSGSSSSGRSSTRSPCQPAASTPTTRAPPRSPRRRRPTPSTSPTRSWPRSSSPRTPRA